MFFSISPAALAAVSILSLTMSVNAQLALQQAQYQGCYSSSGVFYTNSSLTYQYQTSGWCQQQCGGYAQKAAFGLTKGSDCWCGDKLPPNSTKVDNDQCNRPCQGFGQDMCGGMTTWSVYTSGLTTNVESASDSEASSAASSTASSKPSSTPTATQGVSTETQGGQTTVVVTQSASAAAAHSKGASTAGIAAGVVVGIVALAAIIGGTYFFIRNRRRREIEEDHQRQQTINGFGQSAGTIKSEHSSADSRLDPTVLYRRQSDGSIADERDLSRRVLKVTNPDRNTMIA